MREIISNIVIVVFVLWILVVPVIAAQPDTSGLENNTSITAPPVQFPTTFMAQTTPSRADNSSLQGMPEVTIVQDNSTPNPARENTIIDKKNLTESQKKLSTALLLQTMAFRSPGVVSGAMSPGKFVVVYIYLNPIYSTQSIDPYVSEVQNRDEDHHVVVARVDVQELETLASFEGVRTIQEVIPPVVNKGSVTTMGDRIHQTADVRQIYDGRYRGAGMKIGIISNGVDHLAESQARGDLPPDVMVLNNRIGGDEGTAMLEIVHDMVPDAQLYFHDYGGNHVAFNEAIDALVAANCTVICDDVSWPDEPYFEDGIIAKHVNEILLAKPVLYISSAGNDAQNHYYGFFSSVPGTPYHDFSRGTDVSHPNLNINISPQSEVRIFLQWDDQFPEPQPDGTILIHAVDDYDLYLSDTQNPVHTLGDLGYSEHSQPAFYFPSERIRYVNPGSTHKNAQIDIKRYNGAAKNLNLYIFSNRSVSVYPYTVASNSIFGHAAVPEVITVAAVPATNPYTIEPFSSRGPVSIMFPSMETRQKPDISGTDYVAVTGVGGFPSPFSGTSAAAPHIAGVVAQYWGSHPALVPADVKKALHTSAIDLGTPGTDTIYGSGLADALTMQRPAAAFSGTPVIGTAPFTVTFSEVSRGSPTSWAWYFGDETFTGPWTLKSPFAVNTTHFFAWEARYMHSSAVLPDGSIVLMGGEAQEGMMNPVLKNDVWRSMDEGVTWIMMDRSAPWSARKVFSAVAMPDGSIILMGGFDSYRWNNDVWRSLGNGTSWNLVNPSAGWPGRSGHTAVTMNGSIVLMGGYDGTSYRNDVWRSADYGITWTGVHMDAPWTARTDHSSAITPDGIIVLMGGHDNTGYKNDVWQSADYGTTWTQTNTNASWTARSSLSAVVLPDSSIVVMGGVDIHGLRNDVWRSTDKGATWTEVNAHAPWTARSGHSAVVMQNGDIVIMSGFADGLKCIGDTWNFRTAASWDRNPAHMYTKRGFYNVTLQANTTYGHNSVRKTGIINVAGPVAEFGGTPLTGTAPLHVSFMDNSTDPSITVRAWDFGDGTTDSYALRTNPVHIYQNPGTYSVNLTVINGSGPVFGSDTRLRTNYITVLSGEPVANFTGAPLTGTAPLAVSFIDYSTGASTTSRRWDFGDGNISIYAVPTNLLHVYTRSGTFNVTLTASNALGSNQSIRTNYITVVDVVPGEPVANFTGTPLYGTAPLAVSFIDYSPGSSTTSRRWDFGDGDVTNATVQNPVHTYLSGGKYTVSLTASNLGRSNTTTKTKYISVIGGNDGIAIFRPSTGYWYFDYNLKGVIDNSFRYGGGGDQIIRGDWEGKGADGIAIFRPSTGYWYFDYNNDGVINNSFRYGGSTDQIIKGDWDGDDKDGIAIFRPSTGYWYFDNNLDGIVNTSFRYGGIGDQIIKGDWDGDGKDGIAIFRPSTGYWYFDNNLDGVVDKFLRYGGSTDQIIVGKWNSTLQDGIAIFRPSTGYWYFDYHLDGIVDNSFRYGGSTDQIIKGDWDGDGKDGIAIFRPSTGYWYFDYHLDGVVDKSFRYGGSTDQIISGKWA